MWSPWIDRRDRPCDVAALRDRKRRRRHREPASGRSVAEDLEGGRICSAAAARRPACGLGKFFRRTGWRRRRRDLSLRETCRDGSLRRRPRRPIRRIARAHHRRDPRQSGWWKPEWGRCSLPSRRPTTALRAGQPGTATGVGGCRSVADCGEAKHRSERVSGTADRVSSTAAETNAVAASRRRMSRRRWPDAQPQQAHPWGARCGMAGWAIPTRRKFVSQLEENRRLGGAVPCLRGRRIEVG